MCGAAQRHKASSHMHIGLNYPWFNFNWDFGEPPPHWEPSAAWKRGLAAEITNLRSIGVRALRWFILCDGLTLGSGGLAPRPDRTRAGAWRVDRVPSASGALLAHFTRLLEFFSADFQLMPVVVSFGMFQPPREPPPDGAAHVSGGRMDIVNDPALAEAFLRNVLTPLVAVSARREHRAKIYAWDLCNEPEWCTRLPGTVVDPRAPVAFDRMRDFLRRGIEIVRAHGLPATVGFAKYASLAQFDQGQPLGVSFRQFHYYGEPAVLPRFDRSAPSILGEVGTVTEGRYQWPELPPDYGLFDRLRAAEYKGYEWIFLWSLHATDEHTGYTGTTFRHIEAYRAGVRPPRHGQDPRDAH